MTTPRAEPEQPVLSVVVIAMNEATNIRDCLASVVGLADEVVVVDSGSTDGTQALCRELGARVIDTDWPGFGPQKNRAVDAARGQWILSLDADERLTPELRAEIAVAIGQTSGPAGYAMPRLSQFCGRFIRHCGWTPDHVTRLFRRGAGRFSDDLVHERLIVDGTVATLRHPLMHYSYRNYSDVLRKIEAYSTAGAAQAFRRGKRASLAAALGHGLWAFVRTYIVKRGLLDGAEGFGVAVMNAQASYYKYLKLWYLGKRPEPRD